MVGYARPDPTGCSFAWTAVLVTLLLGGCAETDGRWAAEWAKLPHEWRGRLDENADATLGLIAVQSGSRGFRFESTAVSIVADLDKADISVPHGQAVSVHWLPDPKSLYGFIARYGRKYRVWLSTNRLTLRLASQVRLILVDDAGHIVTSLPRITAAYDMDNEFWTRNGAGASDARCVAAEATELSRHEIQRIAHDESAGRLTHDEASKLQSKLAPFLANSEPLCK